MINVKVGTYTGNGGTSGTRAITGVGFQPKFVLCWTSEGSGGELYPSWALDSAIAGLGACQGFWGENAWNTNSQYDRFNSFDADGFTISIGSQTGSSYKNLNKNGTTFYYLAIGGSDVYTGNYTGNGSDSRNITGVGFQPGMVWIMGGSQHTTYKVSATGNSTDSASQLWFANDSSNLIQALQSDGFQVGTANQANANGTVYYYMAIKDSADFVSGQYTGNGADDRDITAPGFQPEFVLIRSVTGSKNSVFRSASMSGDNSKYYRSSGFVGNYVQSLLSNGFQVGSGTDVNANTIVYTYVAMKNGSGGGGGATFIPKTVVF